MDMSTINRRRFLGTVGLAATGVALATSGAAQTSGTNAASSAPVQSPDVQTRTLPRTGEKVTMLGLGTFLTFDLKPGDRRDTLRQVFERYVAAGGRVVDTSPLYGSAEVSVGQFMGEFEGSDDMFLANKVWSTGEYLGDESHAVESFRQSRMRTWRKTINLMQCHSITNAPVIIPLMKAWKKEGLIRHVGVTHHESSAQDQLLAIVQRDDVDFIQTNYSIFNRDAERRLLPTAADKGIGVLINLPLEKARLMKVVEGQPLPGFAAEFGATSWAQFFLKWVMAHPAVTSVLCGTSNPDHMSDNVQAMTGPLPDERMRARMVAHMETVPGFGSIGTMPWYPGKETMYSGLIREAQANAAQRLR
ncbi:aldo/keto reductase [Agrobacterium pusense]|uniref:aldo/keto reductase n=1 Tax=Agrobacterium pusense TaxID=648995 RepID=UPI001C6F27C9|nr:aldo/keto reductase [Agrobacterium pusense]MBW9070142.1 aldo/keto reductase [Agrobacterium pusense]MBW9085018.1 aldo/keto reductase [Agrobacterium pusense]MBW9125507.1 aldo/keto reductase [Agrobacterium pusense]MBW9137922.1 aldo/keto reductase [Agrobacterium pusense]